MKFNIIKLANKKSDLLKVGILKEEIKTINKNIDEFIRLTKKQYILHEPEFKKLNKLNMFMRGIITIDISLETNADGGYISPIAKISYQYITPELLLFGKCGTYMIETEKIKRIKDAQIKTNKLILNGEKKLVIEKKNIDFPELKNYRLFTFVRTYFGAITILMSHFSTETCRFIKHWKAFSWNRNHVENYKKGKRNITYYEIDIASMDFKTLYKNYMVSIYTNILERIMSGNIVGDEIKNAVIIGEKIAMSNNIVRNEINRLINLTDAYIKKKYGGDGLLRYDKYMNWVDGIIEGVRKWEN